MFELDKFFDYVSFVFIRRPPCTEVVTTDSRPIKTIFVSWEANGGQEKSHVFKQKAKKKKKKIEKLAHRHFDFGAWDSLVREWCDQ